MKDVQILYTKAKRGINGAAQRRWRREDRVPCYAVYVMFLGTFVTLALRSNRSTVRTALRQRSGVGAQVVAAGQTPPN